MSTLQSFVEKYHRWRRQTLPQSFEDASWRHDEIVARFRDLQLLVEKHLAVDLEQEQATQQDIRSLLRLLEPQKVVGFAKKRVGSPGDGGYVQIDDLAGLTHAFSFGVRDDDSWDLAMAQAGVPVEQFDHSVDGAPSTHPLLRFHKKMIAPVASDETATLPDLVREYSKSSTPDLFLKIDIEGCEWDVFDNTPDEVLARHAQIVCEFHDLAKLKHAHFALNARRVLEKLNRHFAVTHVHANNCSQFCLVAQIPLPDVLEISFANRARYSFERSDETFPTDLDAPSSPDRLDYVLGSFRF